MAAREHGGMRGSMGARDHEGMEAWDHPARKHECMESGEGGSMGARKHGSMKPWEHGIMLHAPVLPGIIRAWEHVSVLSHASMLSSMRVWLSMNFQVVANLYVFSPEREEGRIV